MASPTHPTNHSISPALAAVLPPYLRKCMRTSNFFRDYFLEGELGEGANGSVLVCRRKPTAESPASSSSTTPPDSISPTSAPAAASASASATPVSYAVKVMPGTMSALAALAEPACTASATPMSYAVKAVPCTMSALAALEIQLSLAQHSAHVLNVVAVYCNELTPTNCPFIKYNTTLQPGLHLLIVMPLMRGGDLFEQVRNSHPGVATENAVAAVFGQVADALALIHARGLVHGDMKLENVLCEEEDKEEKEEEDNEKAQTGPYTNLHATISDFEFTRAATDVPHANCFTKAYASPEILANIERAEKGLPLEAVGACADVWALGVMLYTMLTRQMPFNSLPSEGSGYKDRLTPHWRARVREGSIGLIVLPAQITPAAEDLLRRMLRPMACARITMPDVLRHPFVTRVQSRPAPAGEDPK